MNKDKATELELLLRNLIKEKCGNEELPKRYAQHEGITIDSDSFTNDSDAIKGLWLAVKLLQSK
jgi:hypothetical protein